MPATHEPGPDRPPSIDLLLAADLQDALLIAGNDLDRLQILLSDACTALAASFFGAHRELEAPEIGNETLLGARQHLGQALTALQFQDMASQLIAHTHKRLRHCVDRLAADAFGAGDGDSEGSALVEAPPLHPNPVTQDEMDAGSVELF